MTTTSKRRVILWSLGAMLVIFLGVAATTGGVLAAPRSQVPGTDQAKQSEDAKQPEQAVQPGTTDEDALLGCGSGSLYFEIEPNSTITTAQALTSVERAQVDGSITPIGDIDYYSFSATAGDRIWSYNYTQGASGTDSQLTLLNALSETIQFDDDNGSQAALSAAIAGAYITQTGTYYLRVNEFGNNGTIVPYRLYIDRTTSATVDEIEPNDTIAQANAYTMGSIVTGTIPLSTDKDFYSFSTVEGDKLVLQVDGAPDSVQRTPTPAVQFNPNIEIYNSGGTLVRSVDNDSTTNGGLRSESTVLTYTVAAGGLPPGTYYFAVVSDATGPATGKYNAHMFSSPKVPCGDTPTPTNTVAPTNTNTPTNTRTSTVTPGGPTFTPTNTNTPTNTRTPTPTITPGGPTFTPTNTPTNTRTATPTWTSTNTFTPGPSPTPCGPGSLYFESEPNNLITDAQALGSKNMAQVMGSINFVTDIDYYSFQANAGDRVWAYLFTLDSTSGTDSQLTLLNSLSQTVQFDDDNGSQAALSSAMAGAYITQTGTYYFRLNEFGNDSTILPYTLYIDRTSVAAVSEVEANNTITDANAYTFGSVVTGSIPAASDLDFFSFTTAEGDKLVVQVDGSPDLIVRAATPTVVSQFNPNIQLYNSAGTLLHTIDNDSTLGNVRSEAVVLTFTVGAGGLAPGAYYVAVVSDSTGPTTGPYNLHIAASPKAPCGNTPTPAPPTITNTPTNTRTPTITPTPAGPTSTPTATPCVNSVVLTEGFESGTLNTFSSSVVGVTTTPTPTPGWAALTSTPLSGSFAAFAPDPNNRAEQRLTMNSPIAIPAGANVAEFSFWHRYAFEDSTTGPIFYDGGVIEVSTDNGASWITNTAGLIVQGGYGGTLSTGFNNPLGGRQAWVANNLTYSQVRVNLAGFAGQSVLVRLILGSDISISDSGWWIDDVSMVVGKSCDRVLIGHVLWEDRPPNAVQPNPLQQLPFTITLKSATLEVNYPFMTTDSSGFFTINVSTLPNDTYNYRLKGHPPNPITTPGPSWLASVGSVIINHTLAPLTTLEVGLQKGGDADNSNWPTATGVDVLDFNILKNTFGKTPSDAGYDNRANFAQDAGPPVVDVSDFNTLKKNFGMLAPGPIGPVESK